MSPVSFYMDVMMNKLQYMSQGQGACSVEFGHCFESQFYFDNYVTNLQHTLKVTLGCESCDQHLII